MTIPYREWTQFESAHMDGFDPNPVGVPFNQKSDWSTTVYDYIKVGDSWQLHGGFSRSKDRWHGLTRPVNSSFESKTSLDQVFDLYIEAVVTEGDNTQPQIDLEFRPGYVTNAGVWVAGIVNGQTYNGVDDWTVYETHTIDISFQDWDRTDAVVTLASTPQIASSWGFSYSGGDLKTNDKQDDLFRGGLGFRTVLYDPAGVQPDVINVNATVSLLRVRYVNAVVNSLSINHASTTAGNAVVLTGICFDPPDAELEEHAVGAPGNWNADVFRVIFEGLQGQGDYTLTPGAGVGQFVIDSDAQITATLPAMALGSYNIRLWKNDVGSAGVTANSYAGDFSADSDGRVSESPRMTFTISDSIIDSDQTGPLVLTKWAFKNKAGDVIFRNYSVGIDVMTPDTFYDGRITNISSLRRAIDDNTGLFSVSDMTVDMANNDKEFSKLLADYFLKNQIVEIFHSWKTSPHSSRSSIIQCIVDDHSINGSNFHASLKDITRKYFKKRVPFYICTEDEFSDIDESAIGDEMPEVLGLCSVTSGVAPGAVEAVYVDTVNFEYLAARGSLKSVLQVYSDGTLKTGGGVDYDIVYKDGGRTYINFVLDQGDNKITFNAQGYMFAAWNSANGYVQNPIFIILFLLAFLAEIPIELIDVESFETLAAEFVTDGYDESGHLILQSTKELDVVQAELFFTTGGSGFIASSGRFRAERKNISDYSSTTLRIYDQIDLLAPAKRPDNLRSAVNYAKAIYEFYPGSNESFGSAERTRASSVVDFEAKIEASSPLSFPWTNSSALVGQRLTDILYKRGYGDKRINFSVSIEWIDYLDIFTNFFYQDPFGLSSTGAGEAARLYYVIGLNYNWMSNTIDVEAVDLQWLLRQYFILGDENTLAGNWATASEADRFYGYLGNELTGRFADGEDIKILISEAWL